MTCYQLNAGNASIPKLSTGHYDLGYRFDLSRPIYIRIHGNTVIQDAAFLRSAMDIMPTLPDVNFVIEDKGIEPPFENRVIFAEIDSAKHNWYGIALAAHASASGFKPCYGSDWGLSIHNNRVTDVHITGGLTGQKVANCGLICINKYQLNRDFNGDPATGYEIYLASHEFTHLLGLGHDDQGLMIPGIHPAIPVDWRYTPEDRVALAELGYIVR